MVFSPPVPETSAPTKVLIVEDEGIIASHIASRLAKTGYDVVGIAESSEEALRIIPQVLPQLILMDIRIKGALDGIETTARLRETFDIPVIYLTAHTDQQTIDRAKVTGAFGFLTKPIHHTSLATSIEMAIHKHRADRAVRHQRAWMATVLGTMADAMAVVDSDGHVQFLNRPAEELTGWKNEEARERHISRILPLTASGKTITSVFSPPPYAARLAEIPRGATTMHKSGRPFPIDGEIAVSADEGRIVGTVITFRDATSRQAQEAELRQEYKMRAVGRLAAGIAHDFNNLLFIITGYAEEIMRGTSLSDPDLRSLAEIRKAADSAAGLTQQLLRFSRKEPTQLRDVNVNDIIQDTQELLRRLGGGAVNWHFALDPNLGIVRADHGQLKQVLMNLAANARDAMPDGGRVTIETSNIDVARAGSVGVREAFISVSVSDTGHGMSAETAERLFEPFFTTKELGKGTGLGLSIVHSIVTDLGGSIHVDSAPGKGTTFTVYIPSAAAESLPAPVAAASQPDPVTSATVLLVEDRDAVRFLLREYLTGAGYTVLEAEDGEAAVRVAAAHQGPIDLLVTDVMMPRANGFEVARSFAGRPGIKTIFISGYAQELIDGEESLPPGARFLPKPFVRRDLLKHVSDVLGGKPSLSAGFSA